MRSRISSVDREPAEVLEGDVFLGGRRGGGGGGSLRSRSSRCGCSTRAWTEMGGKGARWTEEGDVFKVEEGRSGGSVVVQPAGQSGRSCEGGDVGLGGWTVDGRGQQRGGHRWRCSGSKASAGDRGDSCSHRGALHTPGDVEDDIQAM